MSVPWRPVVQVTLRHTASINVTMMVDSGADISVIRHSDGVVVGLTVEPGEMPISIRGIGGQIV